MKRIAIIDYGMGNLHSVAKAVEHVGDKLRLHVTADEKTILAADRVIFPGVGAIRDCMAEIKRLGIDQILHKLAPDRPILAICVGLQALLEYSAENDGVECTGLLPGTVQRFAEPLLDASGNRLKVPHTGWNEVRQVSAHPMWKGIADNGYFYFVHGYYARPASRLQVVGESSYPEPFATALAQHNIFAVQFHPEKSQRRGLQLLANFLDWDGGE